MPRGVHVSMNWDAVSTMYGQHALGLDPKGTILRRAMRDYWLNKLFFDIQQPEVAAEYKKDRDAVLARYPMSAEIRRAVIEDDIAALAPHVNAYLLRFYYAILRRQGRRVHQAAERIARQHCGQGEGVEPWLSSSEFSQPVTGR